MSNLHSLRDLPSSNKASQLNTSSSSLKLRNIEFRVVNIRRVLQDSYKSQLDEYCNVFNNK